MHQHPFLWHRARHIELTPLCFHTGGLHFLVLVYVHRVAIHGNLNFVGLYVFGLFLHITVVELWHFLAFFVQVLNELHIEFVSRC